VSLNPQDTVMVLLLSPVFLGIQASRTIAAEDGAPLRLSVSAGCAALDDAEPTAEALLRTADVALSMAKRGGRDRVVAA
jgi:PleD family two-component response regulator